MTQRPTQSLHPDPAPSAPSAVALQGPTSSDKGPSALSDGRSTPPQALGPLLALGTAALWLVVQWQWEITSTSPFAWGESFPNGDTLWNLIEHWPGDSALTIFYRDEVWSTGVRAPGLYLLSALWFRLVEVGHQNLMGF